MIRGIVRRRGVAGSSLRLRCTWLLTRGMVWILPLLLLTSSPAVRGYQLDLAAVSDSINAIELDYSQQLAVNGLVIERGGVKFFLDSGTLTLAKPVFGRVLAAAFTGEGRFLMIPPNSAERYMLTKLCKDTVAAWQFKELAVFATDDLFDRLKTENSFSKLDMSGGEKQLLAGFLDYTHDEFEFSMASQILPEMLQSNLGGSFRAKFKSSCGNMVFVYDPKEVEEITLYRKTTTSADVFPELVSSFHSPDQYSSSQWGPDHENKDLIDSLSYEIDGKIWQSVKTDLTVKLAFNSKVEGLRALHFSLFPDMMLETFQIRDAAGDSLFWQKLKEESGITVYLDKPLNKGERGVLNFSYSSKGMLEKTPWGNNLLVTSTGWYPNYGYLPRCRYKLRFACPSQYTFLSVGDKISEKVEGDFRITEWDISQFPVAMISYNYGEFTRDTAITGDSIPVEVYRGTAHGGLSAGMLQNVMTDITASTSLFSMELVRYPFKRMLATEILAGHGQGMPGFLHLAWSTFQSQLIPYDDAFRAHEVAHQWWGHLVGWESYHDQWLSEGFAEYFGAWYVQRKYMNDEKHKGAFFELVDRWREDVLEAGGHNIWGVPIAYQEGNSAGPIWMGLRLASSRSADYQTLVYSKGAYILYMLRMMMFDFAKRDDSKFTDLLKDFLNTYAWKNATTADFQRIAEKHYGKPLDWFFNEWVYDIQVPSYKWTTTTVQDADGRFIVTVDVQADGVRSDFRMLVPFTIIMEGDYHTTTRLDIDQLNKRIILPKLPYKPVKFIFNPYQSVLCKEKKS